MSKSFASFTMNMRELVFVVCAIFLNACSTQSLLTKDSYNDSLNAYYHGDVVMARDLHPSGETGSFITTMERTYLDLLQGKPNIDALQRYAARIENRVRYDVSRELNSFFYVQTPEDYYASEHEIVWMHLLLSWGYSLRKDYENGCVEARAASHLLSYSWSETGHFDDPMLRIMSGVMWTMCGNWNDAVVDFRAALALDPSLTWLRELSERESPPTNLVIGFGGGGPKAEWSPDVDVNIFRSLRGISFAPTGRRSVVSVSSDDVRMKTYISPTSRLWYERHLKRDNVLHEAIEDSHYGGKALGQTALASAEIAGSAAVGAGLAVGGIALGAGIISLAFQINSEELFWLGVGVGALGLSSGISFISERSEYSVDRARETLDASRQYRYVRYLPEYLWTAWNDDSSGGEIFASMNGSPITGLLKPAAQQSNRRVFLFFYPDAFYSWR